MKYSTFININDQFKSSVNIEYDLLTYEKLSEYIPTEDACEILRYYFNSIVDSKFNRSTILEGPYGKGKSYLVLTLLHLLLLDADNINVQSFIKKLEKVDKDLYAQYMNIKTKKIKLLPIIINSNYIHLSQALNMALKDALDRIGLNQLFPNTAYEISLNVIDQWRKDSEIDSKVVEKCLEQTGFSLDVLERGIKEYDVDSFNKFVELYNCIVKGLNFNPFSSDDVVKNYCDISHKLTQYGYTGIFIVFDEFSKFIESDNEGLSMDLKILQDLAEVVNRSDKNSQMHLCCITHKSFSSYYKNKKEITANAFRTVEGRFKEIRYNRSLNQNYRIISLTLNRKNEFDSFYTNIYKKYEKFYELIYECEIFKDVSFDLISKGCFPLNPLTTFAVVNISELIAQNERTLFTFISDNDTNSLSTFIKNNGEGLFNVDKIYDYFHNLLENSDDEEIRKINYKAQICLTKVGDDLAKRIIKVLAIIKIIKNDNFVPNVKIISLSLNEKEEKVSFVLNELLSRKLFKKSFATECYDFALANTKIIDTKVDAFLISKAKTENLSIILNNIFDSEFILPRKYNTEHKMTRFYRKKYILDFELINLKSFDIFFKKEFCDGIIFNVLNTGIDKEKIKNSFKLIKNNETVILNLLDYKLDSNIIKESFRISALQSVLLDKNLDEIIKDETRLIIADETNELAHLLNKMYSLENIDIVSKFNKCNYTELLSRIMENVFYCTPVINNEMINKEFNVSMQYIKPRNTVVNLYLDNKIKNDQLLLEGFTPTSPENTVFNSIKEKTSIEKRAVLNEIKSFLKKCESNKQCTKIIIEKLKKAPFGIRSGVLPLIFAMAISELDDNILFYFENKEIDLTAENINKMIANSEKYYFCLEKGSNDKIKFIDDMLNIFKLKSTNSFREDIKLVVTNMQKWIMSQPRIIRSQNLHNNFIGIDSKFIEVKNLFIGFNINEYETLFKKLPSIYGEDYDKVVLSVNKYKYSLADNIQDFSNKLIKEIKEIIGVNLQSSLTSAFEDWIKETKADKRVLEEKEKHFVTIFNEKNYDDISMINCFSKIITQTKIADWEKDHSSEILDFVKNIYFSIYNKKLVSELVKSEDIIETDEEEISMMGNLLKNNIEETFEEFADSVSNEEKIMILARLIKEMM